MIQLTLITQGYYFAFQTERGQTKIKKHFVSIIDDFLGYFSNKNVDLEKVSNLSLKFSKPQNLLPSATKKT